MRHVQHPPRVVQKEKVVADRDRAQTHRHFWVMPLPPLRVQERHHRDAEQQQAEGQHQGRVHLRLSDGEQRPDSMPDFHWRRMMPLPRAPEQV